MSKWFSLTLALVVIATSSTASAEVIKRFGRLVAEEQAAPEPQPAAAKRLRKRLRNRPSKSQCWMPPSPDAVYDKGTVIDGGMLRQGATGYGYPFVNGCCTSSYYGSGLWTGYYGRQCGRGCLQPRPLLRRQGGLLLHPNRAVL